MKTTQIKQINEQTPGPVVAYSPHPGQFALVPTDHTKQPDFWTIAYIRDFQANDAANARLLAAAYSSFDRAGRALGIDASELAESVDLAGLIGAARMLLNAPNEDAATFCRIQLRAQLDKLPKGNT